MFKSGTKVSVNKANNDYSQLVAEEYTVKFTYMTDTFTWVVLKEFPEMIFNDITFNHIGEDEACFAVKTVAGGFLISDIEFLEDLAESKAVLGFKKVQNVDKALVYFNGCAVCGRGIEEGEQVGYVGIGDLVTLKVCPECCQKNPQIKAVIPKKPTYHDIQIDWWRALEVYGEMTEQPGLKEDIQKEIELKCDKCEKADCHPDCSPGICPYYLIEDYLPLYQPMLFSEMKQWTEEQLREKYPDPAEQ